MNVIIFGFACFVLGFVVAQALYQRLLNRAHEREQNYGQMLRNSHARYQELSEMSRKERS